VLHRPSRSSPESGPFEQRPPATFSRRRALPFGRSTFLFSPSPREVITNKQPCKDTELILLNENNMEITCAANLSPLWNESLACLRPPHSLKLFRSPGSTVIPIVPSCVPASIPRACCPVAYCCHPERAPFPRVCPAPFRSPRTCLLVARSGVSRIAFVWPKCESSPSGPPSPQVFGCPARRKQPNGGLRP